MYVGAGERNINPINHGFCRVCAGFIAGFLRMLESESRNQRRMSFLCFSIHMAMSSASQRRIFLLRTRHGRGNPGDFTVRSAVCRTD